MLLLNPLAVFSLARPAPLPFLLCIDGPTLGIAKLRSATGAACEGPACLRLRLPSLGGSCSATHLRLALLPAMPRLQLLGPALHRCIRQQRDRQRRSVWTHRRCIRVLGMPEKRGLSSSWPVLPPVHAPIYAFE